MRALRIICFFSTILFVFSCKKINKIIVEDNPNQSIVGSWTKLQNPPIQFLSRMAATSFVVNNKAYIVSGTQDYSLNPLPNYLNDVWEFNPANNVWTKKNNIPFLPRTNAVSFVIGDKAYITTGRRQSGTALGDLWEYNSTNDTWTQRASLPFAEARTEAMGFAIGDKGYVCMGRESGQNVFTNIWEYNPVNDTWTKKKDAPVGSGRSDGTAFSINGKGYVIGGFTGPNSTIASVFEYDPVVDNWLEKQSLPVGEGRAMAKSFVLNNKAFVTCGLFYESSFDIRTRLDDIWEYDAINNKWLVVKSLPNGAERSDHCAFAIGDKAYISTGTRESIHTNDPNIDIYTVLYDIWEFKL